MTSRSSSLASTTSGDRSSLTTPSRSDDDGKNRSTYAGQLSISQSVLNVLLYHVLTALLLLGLIASDIWVFS